MYLRVEFNSKMNTLLIRLAGLYKLLDNKERVVTATYLSRIFINLGTNPVGKVLS